jgi:hypothetical protein
LDGFVQGTVKPATAKITSKTNLNYRLPDIPKSSQVHKRIEKSQTLMRAGLKKPALAYRDSPIRRMASPSNIERELRAKLTSKHNRIDRFGVPKSEVKKRVVTGELMNHGRHHKTTTSRQPTSVATPPPSMITSASHQKLERMLDEALLRADAHKDAMRYHAARHFWQRRWFKGPRRMLTMAGLFAVLAASFMFVWQRNPQVSLKIAGMKAHLHAAIPTYKPEGYSLAGPAKAVMGAVTVKYISTSDNKQSYELTQSTSNLTSNMVAENVIPKGANVQTSQVAGNTIYIYGEGNDAAWVNNGVLYTIKDKANLRSDQLIKIVKGLNP